MKPKDFEYKKKNVSFFKSLYTKFIVATGIYMLDDFETAFLYILLFLISLSFFTYVSKYIFEVDLHQLATSILSRAHAAAFNS